MERFQGKYIPEPNSGCWLWTGNLTGRDYGGFYPGNYEHDIGAHVAAWQLFRGPVPPGLDVCHKCDVPSCVNPDHLFLGTVSDNMQDAKRKGRTCEGDRMRAAQAGKMVSGEAHHKSKVTANDVRDMRMWARNGFSTARIADAYSMSVPGVQKIIDRVRWAHVE